MEDTYNRIIYRDCLKFLRSIYKCTHVFYKYLVPHDVALPELNDYTITLRVCMYLLVIILNTKSISPMDEDAPHNETSILLTFNSKNLKKAPVTGA